MTRRMIDSGMWSNENFAALPPMGRLLQIGIINHADDQGRVKANPLFLSKEVFPYDNVKPANISAWLEQMVCNGTIILYEVEGKQYAQLTKWWEYQSLQYASPSDYPAPPGWQDRIRRTATKTVIVTYNWTLVNGVKVPDTCDEHGKPLAPRQAPRAKPIFSPPSPTEPPVDTNGYSGVDSPECSPDDSIELNLIEDQLNSIEREDHTRAYPSIQPGEYMPGVSLPHIRKIQQQSDTYTLAAKELGMAPGAFRLSIDAVLDATGKRALADAEPEERTLNAAKDCVLTLGRMGFATIEDVQSVLQSWKDNDWRGASAPSFAQLAEHASAMKAGTHVTARAQESGKKEFTSMREYDEWALRHDPSFQRIREGILVKGTRVKRDEYQPRMAH